MSRIVTRSWGATDWRRYLADPSRHWRRGRSAMEIAVSWEYAQFRRSGLPQPIEAALNRHEVLAEASLLIAIPEHKVRLVGRGPASQNDVWALLDSPEGQISMTVEGKVDENFGETLEKWLENASDGKLQRLEALCQDLKIPNPPDLSVRYQLLHRTVSALIEARRFHAPFAVMLIQSFKKDSNSWNDFSAFCSLLGATAVPGGFAEAERRSSQRLFLGWVDCPLATDEQIAKVI